MTPQFALPSTAAESVVQTREDPSFLNVLIVDDNPLDRLQASRLVGLDSRCRVMNAEDGAQALQLMADHNVAIVLTDLKMDRMDGLALVRAVRKDHPHVPVILMTAHGSEDVAMEALRVGATDYVPKARLTQDLHAILSRSLRRATAGTRRRRCLHALLRRESCFELGNDPDLLPPFLEFLEEEMSLLDRWDSTEVMRVTIALDEAIRNAMYHGNLELPSSRIVPDSRNLSDLARIRMSQAPYRDRKIEILVVHEPERSRFVVRDGGSGFDTSKVNRPIDPDDLLRSSGRGLLLMKSFMDFVSFSKGGAEVTLIKEQSLNDSVVRNPVSCDLIEDISRRGTASREPDHAHESTIANRRAIPIPHSNRGKNSLAVLSTALVEQTRLEPDFYKRLLDQLYDAVYFVDTQRYILFWNDTAERLTGYSRDEVVGRRCDDGLLEHVDLTGCQLCDSECPLHRAMAHDHPVQDRVLLRRKDGRRISVDVHIMPVRNNEGKVIGGVETFRDATSSVVVENAFRQIREAADRDPLTGLANRRFLDRMLARCLEQIEQSATPLAVIMSDLDHFKQINDNWGHAVGDQALVQFATILQSQCRQQDLVARFGGEEFIVLLPGHSLDTATTVAERLRGCTARATPKELGQRSLTASFGVAQAVPGESAATLLLRADKALYRAKSNGRDCVEFEPA